ncbi:MAG: UDP-glucose 4-epimerase GalE [Anaerolineales bacterium]|nr:UDP-glucose 4-epimerase GalE [Anaerolineales bacterium]
MNILVTGGAGYIGSVTTAALMGAGHQVTVYDNLVKGHKKAIPEGANFILAAIQDTDTLNNVLDSKPFDAVIHFAAFIEAGESMRDPGRYFTNNTCHSHTLIQAAVAHGIKRFVFSSTAAVYASKNSPIAEDDPLAPANVYGHTKLMIEQMLEWYRKIYGLHYAGLRYFNASGAAPDRGEDHLPETHLIPLTLQVALGQREAISIFGADYPTPDGSCIRDYIHVQDLATAHVLAVDALADKDRLIYNLGNGGGYSVKEVIQVAREVTGHPIPSIETERRPGDAPILVASSEKIFHELGWQPQFPSLHDIIETAWEWHSCHPQGYT